jgi:PEGA domain
MDFLDPRKKQTHRIQLMVGYALIGIAIALGTVVLVYGAYGYSLNTKTGGVIQNGLLFVDSQPGGADIYLNGNSQHANTSARLVLQSGTYTLKLTKSGYHDWQRKFILNEHSIARYVYPLLFPLKPVVTALKTYTSQPGLMSETLDRHWLLVQADKSDSGGLSFDEYDTGRFTSPIETLDLTPSLLSSPDQPSTLKDVEWSADNNHLLIKRSYSDTNEFIILDRQEPNNSVNLNKLFKVAFSEVSLRNKKSDHVYLYNQTAQTLQLGNVADGTVAEPFLRGVLAFKSYGSNLVEYVTTSGMQAGQAQARIWDTNKSYPLYTFGAGSQYVLDTAQFQGHSYYVAGSNNDERVNLYKDPISDIKDPAIGKALPLITLREKGATKVSFSSNARFVAVEAGQNLAVYDLEGQEYYRYSVAPALAGILQWMDGHRLIGSADGHIFVMDYDSTNQQQPAVTSLEKGGLFDGDYKHMFTTSAVEGTGVVLQDVDLRAGTDLPK